MHELDAPDVSRTIKNPLRHAPPAGVWALYHGDLAKALLDLAVRDATAEDLAQAPELELAGLAAPLEAFAPVRVVQVVAGEGEAREWLVRRDDGGQGYVGCYVVGLAAAAGH